MTELVKAQLCEISGDDRNTESNAVDVQFNPTSLRVSISNKTAGGQQAGSQARQRPGTGEIQVNFDLVFDTADEGTTQDPIPVTKKTKTVERFVLPRGKSKAEQTPPRVQFKWGSFVVQGVMESANIDLDLFAPNGTPLRAKVAVSIRGQDPNYRYDPGGSSPGSSAGDSGATPPPPGANDAPRGAPGTRGGNDIPAQVVQAMPGESLQQLAARNGLDPAAWRALAKEITDPLSLPAGIEVALPANLALAGTGMSGSGNAGLDPAAITGQLSLVDATALPATRAASANVTGTASRDSVRTGRAVTQEGGVTGAIARVRSQAQSTAVNASRSAFGMAPQPVGASPAAADEDTTRRPYGSGIPLQPLRGESGRPAPTTTNPTIPGWEALQQRGMARARSLNRRRPVDPCGCDCGPVRRSNLRG